MQGCIALIEIKELYCTTKQEEGKLQSKFYYYSMTAIMDLSFPGQQTATATLCILYDSVLYMPGPRVGKSENGFLRCDT